LRIHPLYVVDCTIIAQAFAELGWNKPLGQYMRYFEEQQAGKRDVRVAWYEQEFAGYVTVVWDSTYPPFRKEGIPEIVDLNVLSSFRRLGIATALLDDAEELISQRKDIAGLGVGMTADYGAALRMYAQRGYLPDGGGLYSHGQPVKFGEQVPVDDELVLYFKRELG